MQTETIKHKKILSIMTLDVASVYHMILRCPLLQKNTFWTCKTVWCGQTTIKWFQTSPLVGWVLAKERQPGRDLSRGKCPPQLGPWSSYGQTSFKEWKGSYIWYLEQSGVIWKLLRKNSPSLSCGHPDTVKLQHPSFLDIGLCWLGLRGVAVQ